MSDRTFERGKLLRFLTLRISLRVRLENSLGARAATLGRAGARCDACREAWVKGGNWRRSRKNLTGASAFGRRASLVAGLCFHSFGSVACAIDRSRRTEGRECLLRGLASSQVRAVGPTALVVGSAARAAGCSPYSGGRTVAPSIFLIE